jgi:hypothetical protein
VLVALRFELEDMLLSPLFDDRATLPLNDTLLQYPVSLVCGYVCVCACVFKPVHLAHCPTYHSTKPCLTLLTVALLPIQEIAMRKIDFSQASITSCGSIAIAQMLVLFPSTFRSFFSELSVTCDACVACHVARCGVSRVAPRRHAIGAPSQA